MTETNTTAAPANDVAPNLPNKILIIVDTQVDFVMRYGKLSVDGAENIVIPGIGILLHLKNSEYAAVLFTYDTHAAEQYIGSLENLGNPETGTPGFDIHCEKGGPGWENVFHASMIPAEIPVYRLEKDVFNMWEKDGGNTLIYTVSRSQPGTQEVSRAGYHREYFFDQIIPKSVDTATVIGVASDFCVKDAIQGLLERGLNVEVIEAATAGIVRDIRQVVADEFAGRVTII